MSEIHAFYDEKRKVLGENLPLDTPLSVGIDPSTVCNFRCNYCAQSVPEKFSDLQFEPEIMSMETFEKIVEQLKQFPRKIKKIHLECKGEPLCNPNIAEMVKMIKDNNIAECVQIITNGSLLTHKMSDELIEAGLDILCVSLQGMTAEKYEEVCGVKIEIDKMVDYIKYYYEHKGDSEIYVKNIDIALNKSEEDKFYSVFEKISDRVFIEKIANLFSSVDYSDIIKKSENINKYGETLYKADICGFPFFYLLIFPNGDVRPCSNIKASALLGNVYKESLIEIWRGSKRKEFLKMQILGNRKKNIVCNDCNRPYENLRPEDRLDNYVEILKKKFDIKECC